MTGPDPDSPTDRVPRDSAAVRVFPPAVPVLTVLGGVLLGSVFPIGPYFVWTVPFTYWIGGAIIIASIYLLGFKAVRTLRRSGQSENPYKKTTELMTTGPFKFTRNPMYLQMVLVCLGFAVLFSNYWIAALTPVCAIVLQLGAIIPEERYLERKFGNTYLNYKGRVRRWV